MWPLAFLALLFLWLTAWPLLWRAVIRPNIDPSRPGLRLETFAQEEIGGKPDGIRLGGPADLVLDRPYASLRGRGVWMVPRDGEYLLRLTCDDHGGLALDRRPLILLHGSSGGQSGYYRLKLEQGPVFFQVTLHNRQGRGWARLEAMPPGATAYAPIPIEQLRPVGLGNLETWLKVADMLEQGALTGLGGLLGAWLWVLALGGGWGRQAPWLRRLGGALAFVIFALLWRQELEWALGRALSRDEHQFVASALLLAREGLLPYAGFPYFHAPYLTGLYALIFPWTEAPLATARAISACLGLGSLGLVFFGALRALAAWPLAWRGATALGLTLLMSQEDLFRFTTGLAWNHDAATFLALLSLIWGAKGVQPGARPGWLAASGLALALAAGVRLSYAPLALAFLVAVLAQPRGRWRAAGTWAWGAGLGSLPLLGLLAWQPDRVIFGNLTYPLLNTQFKGSQGIFPRLARAWSDQIAVNGMDWEKFFNPSRYDALLLLLLGLSLGLWLWSQARRETGPAGPALAWLSLPLLLLGALAPNPLQPQYLYPLVPFAVMTLALTWGRFRPGAWGRPALVVLLGYLAVSLAWGLHSDPPALLHHDPWRAPAQVHRLGQQIAALSPPGPVLTLTPVLALEGGRSIYPGLAAAPFTWRVGPMLDPARRAHQGLLCPQDLPGLLERRPPAAFLLGWEKEEYEAAMKAQAAARGYREIPLAPGLFLWTK